MNFPTSAVNLLVFGHDRSRCAEVARKFGGTFGSDLSDQCDLAIFVIDPSQGIDAATIAQWESLDDALTPRLIAVVGLENSQADFDDAVLLANRVFAPTLTPYLVLHDDDGIACALIRLSDAQILNYETYPPTTELSESEHLTLIAEFRAEYLEILDVMGPDGFPAGLVFPAIPLWLEKRIGEDIIAQYIQQIADSKI